jgi:hypothetical protein
MHRISPVRHKTVETGFKVLDTLARHLVLHRCTKILAKLDAGKVIPDLTHITPVVLTVFGTAHAP